MSKRYHSVAEELPEFIRDTADIASEIILTELDSTDVAAAENLGRAIAEGIAKAYAGELLYVPKMKHLVAERHRRICAAYDGTNRDEICRQFKIKRHLFYKIINKGVRQGWIVHPQQSLFDERSES